MEEAGGGSPENLRFEDLFDLREIQEIQDAFAAATGVASIITDTQGRPITAPSNFCTLCEDIIRKTKKGLANCYHSDKVLGEKDSRGPKMQPCLSGGLWDGGAPIRAGDRTIAHWLAGQVLDDSRDKQSMLAYAREIGADEKAFEAALDKVTRMPREQFEKVCRALYLIARQMSRLALQNAQQTRYIARLNQAENIIRESQQRLALLVEQSPLAVVEWSLGGTIVSWNPMAEKIFGYSPEEAIGRHAVGLIVPSECETILHDVRKSLLERKGGLQYTVDHLTRDGRPVTCDWYVYPLVDAQGRTIGAASIGADITERRRALAALQQSEELHRKLVTTVPEVIIRTDPDGTIVFINETGFPWWNTASPDRVLGKNIMEFVAEADRGRAVENLRLMLGGVLGPREYTLTFEDGSTLDAEVNGDVLRDGDGNPYGMVFVVRDITARKQAEKTILASLHEKELLLKEIHHRVKNNMQVISSLLSLQAQSTQDQGAREMYRDSMRRVRSMALVHEKLYRSADLSMIDFGEYLETVVTELMHASKREEIDYSVESTRVMLEIDLAIPCGLIVNELVSNALKHAFRDGRSGSVRVCFGRRDDAMLELSVSDDGEGFPGDRDHRHMPSMGMTLVLALADQIGGTLSLDRSGGTRFTVAFPDDTRTAARPASTTPALKPA